MSARQSPPLPAALASAAFLLLAACSGEGAAPTASQARVLELSGAGSSVGSLTAHHRTRVVFANAEIPAAPPSRSGFDS